MTSKRFRPDTNIATAPAHAGTAGAPACMLGILADEMRSAVDALGISLELLRRAPAGPEQGHAIDSIARRFEVLGRLADDLRFMAQSPSAAAHVADARVDLNEITRVALDACRAGIEDRRHRLVVHYDDAPLVVEGDAARLRRVIVNLVDNAAKYTPPFGRIMVRTAREGDRAVLRIRDNGIGIAPDKLKRVFDPFVQLVDPRAHRRGVGLGLALARNWVHLHGGSVRAHSEGTDLGSEFVVSFPLLAQGTARPCGSRVGMATME